MPPLIIVPMLTVGRVPSMGCASCANRSASASAAIARASATPARSPAGICSAKCPGVPRAQARGHPRAAAGGRRVQIVPADGRAGPEEVPWSGRGDAWHPRWSPDAERLAFIAATTPRGPYPGRRGMVLPRRRAGARPGLGAVRGGHRVSLAAVKFTSSDPAVVAELVRNTAPVAVLPHRACLRAGGRELRAARLAVRSAARPAGPVPGGPGRRTARTSCGSPRPWTNCLRTASAPRARRRIWTALTRRCWPARTARLALRLLPPYQGATEDAYRRFEAGLGLLPGLDS